MNICMAPIVVSDFGGVIYSFSRSFDPSEHDLVFYRNLDWYAQKVEAFSSAVAEESEGQMDKALEIERLAVTKGFEKPGAEGTLAVYFITEALLALAQNSKNYKIVIVSTSLVETSRLILKMGMKSIGFDSSVVDMFDIHNMAQFGSKKNSDAWGKILESYKSIVAIVEDNEKNLSAAYKSAKLISTQVKKSTKMIVF